MKKGLLFMVFSWWLVCEAQVNLLTRGQIFNFNVGDIFDYQATDINPDTNYLFRIIVTDKFVSLNADTIIYELNDNTYVSYTGLDSIEIDTHLLTDTACNRMRLAGTYAGGTITTNAVRFVCMGVSSSHWWGEGVGTTYESNGNGAVKILIYYSKGNISWGTPIVSATEEIRNPQSEIRIAPTPATTHLTIQLQQTPAAQTVFTLFDITGRMILQQPLTAPTNNIDVSTLSKGMYLYNVVTAGEKAGAGKLVVE